MDRKRKTNLRRSTRSAANYSSPSSANYTVKWNLQSTHILNELAKIYYNDGTDYDNATDVTLFSSEGDCVPAHKIVLMLCSSYFKKLFQKVSTSLRREREGSIVVLGNVKTSELLNLIRFIYTGEVHVTSNEELEAFHDITKLFEIEGVSSSKNAAVSNTALSSARRGRPPSSTSLKIKVLDQRPKKVNIYSAYNYEQVSSAKEDRVGKGQEQISSSATPPFFCTDGLKQTDQQQQQDTENVAKTAPGSVSAADELEPVECKIEPSDDNLFEEGDNDFDKEEDAVSNFSDEIRDGNLLSEEDEDDDDDKCKDPDVSCSSQRNVSISKPMSKTAQMKETGANVNLNWRTGKLRGYVKIEPISEETLKKDWRRKGSLKCIDTVSRIYYCAYGKNSCPASLKVKTLADGTNIYFRNAYEHANHRGPFGLSAEQKAFVMQCLEAGVTQPSTILYKFESSGVPRPEKLKLVNMLTRLRKRVGPGKYWIKKEPKWPRRIRKKPTKCQDEPRRKRGRPSKEEIAAAAASSKAHTNMASPLTSTAKQTSSVVPSVPAFGADSKIDSNPPQSQSLLGLQPHPNHCLGQIPSSLNPIHHPYYPPSDNNFR